MNIKNLTQQLGYILSSPVSLFFVLFFILIFAVTPVSALRNPAAVYCKAMGYVYFTESTEDGFQGMCILPDGRSVGAWDFFLGKIAQEYSYCAEMGYNIVTLSHNKKCFKYMTDECAFCVMPDGTKEEVSTLMELSFKETSCGDDTCGVPENYSTCPDDCPSGGWDGYCDMIRDGIIDPDCKKCEDPDEEGSCANMPPTAEAGNDQNLEAGVECMADVVLDGSSSSDPDEDTLSYNWTWNGGAADGVNPTIQLPKGTTPITLIVSDGTNNSGPDTVFINVQDTTAPNITLGLSPDILWPPNHKMVEVVPDIQTSDVCCDSVSIDLIGVQMNEVDTEYTFDPINDIDDDAAFIGNDVQIVGDSIFLRAERSGKSNGRVYTITYKATDCDGNTSTATATVTVPHDQR